MVSVKPLLMSPIQVDEVHLGGRKRNKRADKKPHAGRGAVGKTPVIDSYDEATGQIWLEAVHSVDGPTMRSYFRGLILPGTKTRANQAAVYDETQGIARESVDHSKRTALVERRHHEHD